MDYNKFLEIFSESEILENKISIKSNLREAILFVKGNYNFDILMEIIGNHKDENHIELIYHMFSSINQEDLFISISTEKNIETVSDIFPSSIFDEDEIYDLFGVNFIGHKDLKRLYMPNSWKGHPLRKDYVQDDERLSWND